MFLFW